MVPLPLCTWLLWACSLGTKVAHSGNVYTLRTVRGVAQSVCEQQPIATLVKAQTGDNALRLILRLQVVVPDLR